MIFSVYNKSKKNEEVKLPDSAIRFRVLANSNSLRDQKIKEEVRDKMQKVGAERRDRKPLFLLRNQNHRIRLRNLIDLNLIFFPS